LVLVGDCACCWGLVTRAGADIPSSLFEDETDEGCKWSELKMMARVSNLNAATLLGKVDPSILLQNFLTL